MRKGLLRMPRYWVINARRYSVLSQVRAECITPASFNFQGVLVEHVGATLFTHWNVQSSAAFQ